MTSQEEIFNEVSKDPYKIRKHKSLSEELILSIIQERPSAIRYFTDESPEMQMKMFKTAFKKNKYISPNFISTYKDPCEKLQIELIRENGDAFQYIKEPSYDVQLEGVRKSKTAILHIENPTQEIQLEAVRNNPDALQYILNPSVKVQREAMKKVGEAIRFIENPTLEVQLEAVEQNGMAIRYIENPTLELQSIAVEQHLSYYKYIKNPLEETKTFVIEKLYEVDSAWRRGTIIELLPIDIIDKYLEYEAKQNKKKQYL